MPKTNKKTQNLHHLEAKQTFHHDDVFETRRERVFNRFCCGCNVGNAGSFLSNFCGIFALGNGDAAVVLMRLTVVQCLFNLITFCCLLESTGQSMVVPRYELAGARHMYEVDFGDSFQGITTAIAVFVFVVFSYKWMIRERSEAGIHLLTSLSHVLCLMLLQMTVVYGNIYSDIFQIHQNGVPGEFCTEAEATSDASHCVAVAFDGCKIYRARFTANEELSGFALGIVVFASFMLLFQIIQSVLLVKWGPKVIAYTADGGPLLSGDDTKHYT